MMQARRFIPTVPHPNETLKLVKAFLAISCAAEREKVLSYAELIAAEDAGRRAIEISLPEDDDQDPD